MPASVYIIIIIIIIIIMIKTFKREKIAKNLYKCKFPAVGCGVIRVRTISVSS